MANFSDDGFSSPVKLTRSNGTSEFALDFVKEQLADGKPRSDFNRNLTHVG